MKQVQKLKKELAAAIVSLMIAATCLTSATYAWYVTNNTVKATTSSISAKPNGFILQIATNVGYDGIIVHVYIWMEGTDADCVNGKSIENDPSTYDVTVKFAGVANGN